MKKSAIIIGIIIVVVVLVGILIVNEKKQDLINVLVQEDQWSELVSDDGGFTISFPSTSVIEMEEYDITMNENVSHAVTNTSYVSKSYNGSYFSADYFIASDEFDKYTQENILKASLLTKVKDIEGAKVTYEVSEFNQYASLDYIIDATKHNKYLMGKLIAVNGVYYELEYEYDYGSFEEEKYNLFIDSFTLK